MKKVVSVIIPVYNVEEFIFRTVESVMNQDYKSIEIILVDDGSPDNSAKIIDELAKKDDRIVCVHKENGGVSSARNAGLRIASGEYVTFIDGDDWVEPKYISYLLNLVESNKCEIGMNKNNYSDYNTKSNEEEYRSVVDGKNMLQIKRGGCEDYISAESLVECIHGLPVKSIEFFTAENHRKEA